MPLCVLCDSQSFDILDGLYFCTECGTQSQDIREEVEDTRDQLVSNRLQVTKGRKKTKQESDFGKPWFTLEGFQVLIKKQVEYLIKLGVDAKLKDVVGQMWFRFVELTTDVFKTTPGAQSTKKGSQYTYMQIKRKRDDIKDYVPVDSIYRPWPKFLSRQKGEDDDEALELSSEIAREEFYEDDDPTVALFVGDSDSDNGDTNLGSEYSDATAIGSIDMNIHRSPNAIGYMSLGHTLAFCFLGLLWVREPICLSDLIRWARDGSLPYFNCGSHFPSHMKFSQNDAAIFGGCSLPTKKKIHRCAVGLQNFLALFNLPTQSIKLYIARYVIDLQLPDCVHQHVQNLTRMVEFDSTSVPSYDEMAMAYILLSLKLIYGLNGVTEFQLEELAVEIPQGEDNSYFPIWSDILELITTCQNASVESGVPWNMEEFNRLKDCRNYSDFCRENIFGSWQPPATVKRYRRFFKGSKGLNEEKQEEYAGMFGMFLNKDDVDEKPNNLKAPSSFPLLCGKRDWLKKQAKDEIHQWATGRSHESEQSTGRKQCESFVEDPFRGTKKHGLSMETISRYYRDGREESTETADDGHVDTQPRKFISYENVNVDELKNILKQSQLLCTKHWNAASIPNSLRSLVEVCSKVIETDPLVLYTSLHDLEAKLLKQERS